ncbi:MAG: ATP-binding cassette domain-containing protein [Planctomycetes bacterium]|nr:ATP-binding cassette domain-containing protein [Planctomycetota bacterium]
MRRMPSRCHAVGRRRVQGQGSRDKRQGWLEGRGSRVEGRGPAEGRESRVEGREPERSQTPLASGPQPSTLNPQSSGRIAFESVTFGYEHDRPVLSDLSLDVRPGESIALVGPTGAGKSTLVSLIPRFFDPWQGRITLDGFDLREVKLASLRSQIAIVLQEPFLLPLTIAENIAYGRPEATRDQIEAAARAARAHDFIEKLPEGYDAVIGERGATLSGGEKQRLSIARALVKDASVVILDEPTSALDVHTESLLLEAVERLTADRTTFVIAHRLSTIERADRIIVLDGGRIVETGTHAELSRAGGLYERYHKQQVAPAHAALPSGSRRNDSWLWLNQSQSRPNGEAAP